MFFESLKLAFWREKGRFGSCHANPATTRLYDKRKDRPEESPTFRVMY
jgi:hypothetical protein